jgi:hypothetical protein
MRVKIIGDCESAGRVRRLVDADRLLTVGGVLHDVSIEIVCSADTLPTVDVGAGSLLGDRLVRYIGELAPGGSVLVHVSSGEIKSDRAARLTVPANGDPRLSDAVERGCYRALIDLASTRKRSWFTRSR